MRGLLPLKKDVRVRVDEAGKDGRARKVDDAGAVGDPGGRGIADALDSVAANHDDLIPARRRRLSVDQRSRADHEHRLRGRGWEIDGGDLWTVLERLDSEGCSRFVVTDVTKDGTLTGPNIDLLANVAECTDAPVIASGGVSSLDDLRAIAMLTEVGVEGAIVGKALYAGRFTLPQALAAVGR